LSSPTSSNQGKSRRRRSGGGGGIPGRPLLAGDKECAIKALFRQELARRREKGAHP